MSNSTISLISTIRQQFKTSKQIDLAMKAGKSKKTGGGSYVDMEEEESTLEVVKVQKPKQVANVVGIKQLMNEQVLIETNPFFVDRDRLLEFFRKCCFTFGSHRRFEQKCRLLMDAVWETHSDFLDTIEKRDEFLASKLEDMIILDIVLRMFHTSLLVKYVSYTATEVFYTFCTSLVTMHAITWRTVHCLVTVMHASTDKDRAADNTYMGRWCDSYSQKRIDQFKNFFDMLYRPCHFETMGALKNMDFHGTDTTQFSFFPHKTVDHVREPAFMGILLYQDTDILKRAEIMDADGTRFDNCILDAVGKARSCLQAVAVILKTYIEYDGSDCHDDQFAFVIANDFMDDMLPSHHYYSAYVVPGEYDETIEIPICKQAKTGGAVPFPSMEAFRRGAFKILKTVHRY